METLLYAMRTLRELQKCNTSMFTHDERCDYDRQLNQAEDMVDDMIKKANPLDDLYPFVQKFVTMMLSDEQRSKISDGYHTFEELYEHRIVLFMTLAEILSMARSKDFGWSYDVWRSKLHSDGTSYEGWFVLGINKEKGKQITYHLPMSKWDECVFAIAFEKAPEYDGHTPADVLERLKTL